MNYWKTHEESLDDQDRIVKSNLPRAGTCTCPTPIPRPTTQTSVEQLQIHPNNANPQEQSRFAGRNE